MRKLTYAIDFDGTLCEAAFPNIGPQREIHKKIMEFAIKKKEEGHIVILWTCRQNRKEGNFLTEAIEWCKLKGLHFSYINENPTCLFGDYGRKILADYYIDDKAICVYNHDINKLLKGESFDV